MNEDEINAFLNQTPESYEEECALHDEFWKAAQAILDKVRAGEMTEDEAVAPLMALDRVPEVIVRNFMLHQLHQDELERIRKETGRIIH
jgi:hypothetical protein